MEIISLIIVLMIIATVLLGWIDRFSYVQMLIVGNLMIFVVIVIGEIYGYSGINADLGFRAHYLVSGDRPYTAITYMFIHSSFVHVIGNILFLFLIGVQLEYRVGKWRTFVLYFAGGIGALIFQSLYSGLDSTVLMVGASGAIAGLVGAMLMLYPRDRIPMMLGPIFLSDVPVILAALVFLATQFVLVLFEGEGSNVAYMAHIGGFVTGLVLAAALPKPTTRAGRKVDVRGLDELAVTEAQREELSKIETETEPDVRDVWLEHFVSTAKCPRCGSSLILKGNKVECKCGYEVKLK